MKEEDFDQIGTRLYDHQADPPKDGWDKIAGVINTPNAPGKISWLKKRFWIPLVVLVPIASWWIIAESKTQGASTTSVNFGDTLVAESAERPIMDLAEALPIPVSPPKLKRRPEVAEGQPADLSAESLKDMQDDRLLTNVQTVNDNPRAVKEKDERAHVLNADSVNYSEVIVEQTKPRNGLQTIVPERADKETKQETKSLVLAKVEPSEASDTLVRSKAIAQRQNEEHNQEETKQPAWRLNFSFTPQYVTRSVRPIADDEVFVTKIQGDKGTFIDRFGLGFAIGAGKAVSTDLYVDAHVAFSQSTQSTVFSSSNGKVDTLLAVQQPDQSVRVIPVYEETDRETMSRYSYGGLRIAATYYFLSTPRGRFNIQAGAGIHYLLSANVKEKVAGQWIALDNTDLSKTNYTLTVAAGYTLDLNTRWALMINPALTYHLKQVKNDQLPYRLNQRPFGLNIMLSRSL